MPYRETPQEEMVDPEIVLAMKEILAEVDEKTLPSNYWEASSGRDAEQRWWVEASFPGDWDPLCEDHPYYESRDQARFAAQIHRAIVLAPERVRGKKAVKDVFRGLADELLLPGSALDSLVRSGASADEILAQLAAEMQRRASL